VVAGDGNYTIHVGNGEGDVVTVGGGTDVISVGSGLNDTVNFGSGQDMVTFGAHASSITLFDTANLAAVTAASFAPPTTSSQVSILAGGLDTITGLAHGDHIILPASDALTPPASNLAGVPGDVVFTTGTLGGGVFSYSASGHDALMSYDNGSGGIVQVVLIGGAAESAHVHDLGGGVLSF
jgi:hypothetical protein